MTVFVSVYPSGLNFWPTLFEPAEKDNKFQLICGESKTCAKQLRKILSSLTSDLICATTSRPILMRFEI
jgi:hypothetical protein